MIYVSHCSFGSLGKRKACDTPFKRVPTYGNRRGSKAAREIQQVGEYVHPFHWHLSHSVSTRNSEGFRFEID